MFGPVSDAVTEGVADRGHSSEIAFGGVADAELERPIAVGDQRPRLLDEGRRFLIAERHAARVRRNGSSGAAEQPIQWPADDLYTFPQTPTSSVAVIPTMSSRSVVLAWWATAPGERPWCDSPQPITPSSVVTFTTTESRLTARPIRSVTLASGGTGNDVGNARTSAMLMRGLPARTIAPPRAPRKRAT